MRNSCIYFGNVMHKRLRPFTHRFSYRIYAFLFDLDELSRLDSELPFFSYNRPGLFSFHDKDHGPRDGSPLKPWAEDHLARAGVDVTGGRIALLCLPRLLGYAFNPLTMWFCYDRADRLQAVIYEVSNTFGERHCYLLPVDHGINEGGPVLQDCDKGLYVSPFIPMESRYRFRLLAPGRRLSVLIRQSVREGEILLATWTGRRAPMARSSLFRAFFFYPLLTFKVIAAIHWQALWLWVKGATYQKRPVPPARPVSYQPVTGRRAAE